MGAWKSRGKGESTVEMFRAVGHCGLVSVTKVPTIFRKE